MFETYKNEMKKFGPIMVPWKNPFEFETTEVKGDKSQEKYGPIYIPWKDAYEFEKILSIKSNIDENEEKKDDSSSETILPTNVFENVKTQNFSIPKPIISYIFEKASHKVLRKLFVSCKIFFAKKRTPICYKLEALCYNDKKGSHPCYEPELKDKDFNFVKETFYFDLYFQEYDILKKFHVTTRLKAVYIYRADLRKFATHVIPKLYRCDAKYILISNQRLYFGEFKFLVGHGNVRRLILTSLDSKIMYRNTEATVFLEDVMALLPKIQELSILNVKINSNTAQILANQIFLKKFKNIEIKEFSGEPFNPYEFLNYCIKNGEKDFKLHLLFCQMKMKFIEFSKELNEVMKDPIFFSKSTLNEMRIE